MKKMMFFVLGLVVLVFSFSLGRVSAKGDSWHYLFGENNDRFVILQRYGDLFFMGKIEHVNNSNMNFIEGIMKNKKTNSFQYYVKDKALVKMNFDSIAFGKIGEDKEKNSCITKGYAFKLDLSSYDKYSDKGCEPLGGNK